MANEIPHPPGSGTLHLNKCNINTASAQVVGEVFVGVAGEKSGDWLSRGHRGIDGQFFPLIGRVVDGAGRIRLRRPGLSLPMVERGYRNRLLAISLLP